MTVNDGPFSLTVSAPSIYAGVYNHDTSEFAGGPIVAMAVRLAPASAIGDPITIVPALKLVRGDKPITASSLQIRRGATDRTPGPVVVADQGQSLTVVETVTNADGTRISVSAAMEIPAASTAPVVQAAPEITGTPKVGQTLAVSDGTWAGTAPISFTRQWRAAGAAISGAAGATYRPVAGDVGKVITCMITAANGTVPDGTATSAPTEAVTANVGGYTPTSLGTKLIGAYDFRTFDGLRADTDGTGAITTAGKAAKHFRDIGPRGNHFSALGDGTPGNLLSAAGETAWNNGLFIPAAPMTGIVEGMEIYSVIDNNADTRWSLLGSNGADYFIGLTENTTPGPNRGFTGAIFTTGAAVLTVAQRADLHAAWSIPTGYVVAGARNIIGLPGNIATGLLPLAYTGGSVGTSGSVRYIVMTQPLTTSERTDLIAFLETLT